MKKIFALSFLMATALAFNSCTTDEEDDFGDWLDENDSFEDEYRIVYMDQAPITQLAASEQDFLPKDISGVIWEKILDTNGYRVTA